MTETDWLFFLIQLFVGGASFSCGFWLAGRKRRVLAAQPDPALDNAMQAANVLAGATLAAAARAHENANQSARTLAEHRSQLPRGEEK